MKWVNSVEKVYDYLKTLLDPSSTVVVGVSGGPDSMALLYILVTLAKKKSFSLICCHVNHNVRKESKEEKVFLENWCYEHGVLFESMTIEHYSDDNFHNEARNIRYRYFEEMVAKYQANYLMTAHHGDDLVETILMRLVRGSTLRGYAGFKREVDKGSYLLVRPLISVSKQELLDYDEKMGIPYVIDNSNHKDKYTRNRYRKYVLPFLKQENPNVHEKFLKFSTMLGEYSDFIDRQVDSVFASVYRDGYLDIPEFLTLDSLLQTRTLYRILEEIYQDDLNSVNDRHVQLFYQLVFSRKKNTYILLPNHVKIVKSYDQVKVVKDGEGIDHYEIELVDYAILPNGKHLEIIHHDILENGNDICRLDSQDIVLPLYVRTRKYGDKMAVKGLSGTKKLKDIFINSKVPMEERELWPVVVDATGNIVWVPGIKKSKINKQKNESYDIIIKYY